MRMHGEVFQIAKAHLKLSEKQTIVDFRISVSKICVEYWKNSQIIFGLHCGQNVVFSDISSSSNTRKDNRKPPFQVVSREKGFKNKRCI